MLLFMIAVSVSLDSFLTGIVFGLKKMKISCLNFFAMVFLFFLYCFIGHFFALAILSFGQNYPCFLSVLRFLGKISLFIIGLYFLYEEHKEKKSSNQTMNILTDPLTADTDKSGTIDIVEALFLTMALSLDTIIAVISTVITGTTGILSSLLFGFIQSIFLLVGLFSGKILSSRTIKANLSFIKASPGYLLLVAGFLRFFFN